MEGEIVRSEGGRRAEGSGKLSLVRKLAEIMGEVTHVPKDGNNAFHGYKYATEAAIVASVRKGMAERRLVMNPHVVRTEWSSVPRKQGGADRLCTLTVRFTVHDGESGEELAFDVLGEGQDSGDKATYKAMTGAVKYALLKLFLIPTGDDPEQDEAPAPKRAESKSPRHPVGSTAEQSPQDFTPPAASQSQKAESKGKPAHLLTIEEAEKKDRTKEKVHFGTRFKGRIIADLKDDELGEALDEGEAKLKAEPKAWWGNALRNNLTLLTLEYEAREKRAGINTMPLGAP